MPPVKLTKAQAREMQDALIAEYSKEEFQKRLHMVWYLADCPAKRLQSRQELCLEVQGPIISRYGFEASRRGVAESVRAFSQPELAGDAEIAQHNDILSELVNPEQAGSCRHDAAAADASGRPQRQDAAVPAASARSPVAREAKPPSRPQPAAPRPAGYRSQDPEASFLLRFGLGPPGGLNVMGTQTLTRQSALDMLGELIDGFTSTEFQVKLRSALQAAGEDQRKQRAARQKVCQEVQIPVVARYGFEASFNGVLMSTAAFTPEISAYPDVAQKTSLVFWLINPGMQAHAPVPTGPLRIMLRAAIRVHCSAKGLLCTVDVDVSSTIRSIKESVQLSIGVMVLAQRLSVGTTELDDWVPLRLIVHVGGTGDVLLGTRDEEKVTWLSQLAERPDVLEKVPSRLLGDVDFIVSAVPLQARILSLAPKSLQANKQVFLRIVQQSGQSLQYAAAELQGDREVVLAAVRRDGWALQYAAPALQADREVVLNAINEDGWAIQFAASTLRADREVVLLAASKDGWIIQNVSSELQADREVALAAVRQDWRVLEALLPQHRADREIITVAVRQDGWALEFAPPELRADRAVVLEAVRRRGEALRFVPKELCGDRDIAYAAVKSCGVTLAAVPPSLQDLEMVMAAIKQDMRALQFVEPRLHAAVKEKLGLHHVPGWDRAPQHRGFPESHDAPVRMVLNDLKKHLSVLGLPESASPEEIKRSYRQLALRHHPDKHPGRAEEAKQTFQAINTAYQVLKNALNL